MVSPHTQGNHNLLAPIKAYSGAVKVIEAGADEIYCGVRVPGLEDFELYRGASTDIQTYDEFKMVAEHAHENSVEVLVTINQPYIIDSMEKPIKKHIQRIVEAGADNLIIGDLGLLQLVKEVAGDIKTSASTYLSATNNESVDFLKRCGFDRVILERHTPIEQIKEIADSTDVEVEVFIHGSGCSNVNVNCYFYHYKFQELDEAYIQTDGIKFPCSLNYEVYSNDGDTKLGDVPIVDAYSFCSLCKLPELLSTGVCGFKIEGRGINEEYQASTTQLYRHFIDLLEKGDTEQYQIELEKVKDSFIPLPRTLPITNLRELCCDQQRCYYTPHFYAPYHEKLSWQAWTKLQCKMLVVQ